MHLLKNYMGFYIIVYPADQCELVMIGRKLILNEGPIVKISRSQVDVKLRLKETYCRISSRCFGLRLICALMSHVGFKLFVSFSLGRSTAGSGCRYLL